MMKYYQRLHQTLMWEPTTEPWLEEKASRLTHLLGLFPSGSGIDAGVELLSYTKDRMEFEFGYHHMDEHGFYAGWTDHKLIITPAFDGINIRITGRNKNQVKEYLLDLFHYTFHAEVSV